jgi:Polyketide cyclase / dehydrase and lipid transport
MTLLLRIISALIALLIVAILVLVGEGHRKDAGIVRVTADINATPQEIWPWIETGQKARGWVSGLLSVNRDPSSPPPGQLGATEIWVTADRFLHDGEIFSVQNLSRTCTEYGRPSRLSMHLTAPGELDGDETYLLLDVGGGRTQLDVTEHLRYSGRFVRLLEPFITRAAQGQMEQDVGRLKGLVEKR